MKIDYNVNVHGDRPQSIDSQVFSPEKIEEHFNRMKEEKDPTQYRWYEEFMAAVAKACLIGFTGYADYNKYANPNLIYKDAKKSIKFLKSQNFNFEPVKTLILKDLFLTENKMMYYNKKVLHKPASETKADRAKLDRVVESYYAFHNVANSLDVINENYNNIFNTVKEIAEIKQKNAQIGVETFGFFASYRKKANENKIKMLSEKVKKMVQKMELSPEQIQQMLQDKCNSTLMKEVIDNYEKGKELTAAQQQAIVDDFYHTYGDVAEIVKETSKNTEI